MLPSVEDNIVSEAYFSNQKPSKGTFPFNNILLMTSVTATAILGATSLQPTSANQAAYYVIVPCTFLPGSEAKFSVNIKTEKADDNKNDKDLIQTYLLNPGNDEWPLYQVLYYHFTILLLFTYSLW